MGFDRDVVGLMVFVSGNVDGVDGLVGDVEGVFLDGENESRGSTTNLPSSDLVASSLGYNIGGELLESPPIVKLSSRIVLR
jgi:hypothetical protein